MITERGQVLRSKPELKVEGLGYDMRLNDIFFFLLSPGRNTRKICGIGFKE